MKFEGENFFFSEEYLSSESPEYGVISNGEYCVSYIIKRPLRFFKILIICSTPIKIFPSGKIKDFLDFVVIKANERKVDWIQADLTHAIFTSSPSLAEQVPFGEYILDLNDATDDELLLKIHSKHRNAIKRARKIGCEIKEGKNINEAIEIIQNTKIRQNLPAISREKLTEYVKSPLFKIFTVQNDGEVSGVAGIAYDTVSSTAYYLLGGSKIGHPPGALNFLHYEIIKALKKDHIKHYNFVGARLSPDKSHKTYTIQRFKLRFGGDLHRGVLWRYVISKFKYRMFEALKWIYYSSKGMKYKKPLIDQELKRLKNDNTFI